MTILVYDPRLYHIHRSDHKVQHWLKTLKPFRAVLPGMFVQNMTLGVMLPILQPFVTHVLHFDHWQFAELLVGSGAFTVLLLVPMGRITDRFGLKVPLVTGFFLAGCSLTAVGIVRHFWPLIVAGGFLGLSYAMILPSWNAFLAGMIPKEIEGWLWGIFMTVEGMGMSVGPIIGARLFGYRIWAPFMSSALILFIMGVFYTVYPLRKPARH
jgi:MFS family permease